MLPALLNTTVIWLSSLLLYELLLKGETFHRLNRFYLLFTFGIGIVLPLLPWADAVHLTVWETAAQQPAPVGGNLGGDLLPGTPFAGGTPVQRINWLVLLYIAGVVGSSLFLFFDCYKLWRLVRRSAISRQGHWKIAETGMPHGPFSFGNILFVSRQNAYTPQQWHMVLQHEGAHFRRRHLFDLILLQAAQIFLWFHPLVYLYRNKLRLLHEYEADSLQEEDRSDYGHFLLQQATVSTPYRLTHELHFSPLKKRIHMLTKNESPRTAQWRFLILLPLLSLSLWCCAQNGPELTVDIKGDYAMRRDAVIAYPKTVQADTVEMQDPVTGEWSTVIFQKDPVPVTLNNQPIAQREELSTTPQCLSPGGAFGLKYLVEKAQLGSLLEHLPNGDYHLAVSEIIIDPAGKIAYYQLEAPRSFSPPVRGRSFPDPNAPRPTELSEADKAQLQKQLSQVLLGKGVAFTPVKNKQDKATPYFLDFKNYSSGFLLRGTFTVKDHQLSAFEYSL